eukprot:gene29386-5739_t
MLAKPGVVLTSSKVWDVAISDSLLKRHHVVCHSLGMHQLKGVSEPVYVEPCTLLDSALSSMQQGWDASRDPQHTGDGSASRGSKKDPTGQSLSSAAAILATIPVHIHAPLVVSDSLSSRGRHLTPASSGSPEGVDSAQQSSLYSNKLIGILSTQQSVLDSPINTLLPIPEDVSEGRNTAQICLTPTPDSAVSPTSTTLSGSVPQNPSSLLEPPPLDVVHLPLDVVHLPLDVAHLLSSAKVHLRGGNSSGRDRNPTPGPDCSTPASLGADMGSATQSKRQFLGTDTGPLRRSLGTDGQASTGHGLDTTQGVGQYHRLNGSNRSNQETGQLGYVFAGGVGSDGDPTAPAPLVSTKERSFSNPQYNCTLSYQEWLKATHRDGATSAGQVEIQGFHDVSPRLTSKICAKTEVRGSCESSPRQTNKTGSSAVPSLGPGTGASEESNPSRGSGQQGYPKNKKASQRMLDMLDKIIGRGSSSGQQRQHHLLVNTTSGDRRRPGTHHSGTHHSLGTCRRLDRGTSSTAGTHPLVTHPQRDGRAVYRVPRTTQAHTNLVAQDTAGTAARIRTTHQPQGTPPRGPHHRRSQRPAPETG